MQASYLAGGAQDFGDTVAGIDEGAGEPGPIGVSALDADRQDVACGGESVDERLVTVFGEPVLVKIASVCVWSWVSTPAMKPAVSSKAGPNGLPPRLVRLRHPPMQLVMVPSSYES